MRGNSNEVDLLNSINDSIKIAYNEEINSVIDKITFGISTIVRIDKEVSKFFYDSVFSTFKKIYPYSKLKLVKLDDELPLEDMNFMTILQGLKKVVGVSTGSEVILIRNFDLLISSESSSSGFLKHFLNIYSMFPDLTYIVFVDPLLPIPNIINELFKSEIKVSGIERNVIKRLLYENELEDFNSVGFSPYILYKYTSGLNVVVFRKLIKSIINNRLLFMKESDLSINRKKIIQFIKKVITSKELEIPDINLDKDIGGYENVKNSIKENVIHFIEKVNEYSYENKLDLIEKTEELIPRGILFYGPPGTGKTLFAKALATKINAAIYIVNGPEIKSKWYGESEQNIRKIFYKARKNAPSRNVISATSGGVDHSIVNQLLTELDGVRKKELVIFVGTTNFVESIDAALLRPGRIELKLFINYPDEEARRKILDIYIKKYEISLSNEQIEYIIEKTDEVLNPETGERYTGDHINSITKSIKREIIRSGKTPDLNMIKKAFGIAVGKNKLSFEDENIVAIHELGHAIVTSVLLRNQLIKKITINTENNFAAGFTQNQVIRDKYVYNKEEILNMIKVLLGGRAAEKLFFNTEYVGSSSDLERATMLAELMVMKLGFSNSFGGVFIKDKKELSDDMKSMIDNEVKEIISRCDKEVETIILENKEKILVLRDKLISKKTLYYDDIKEILYE